MLTLLLVIVIGFRLRLVLVKIGRLVGPREKFNTPLIGDFVVERFGNRGLFLCGRFLYRLFLFAGFWLLKRVVAVSGDIKDCAFGFRFLSNLLRLVIMHVSVNVFFVHRIETNLQMTKFSST